MKRTAILATFAAGAVAQRAQPNPAPVPLGPKPAGCSKFEVLVARGTSEPGPYGFIVGDPLIGNITKAMPDARGYAVQYPADLSDASVSTGAKDVVDRLEGQAKACPEQKFALVGYSQGGIVMHQAASKIPEAMQNEKIMALVMFGDPGLNNGKAKALPPVLAKKLWENCAVGDPVCTSGKELAPHLTYSAYGTRYQEDSMKFIMAAFEGKPMPARPMAPLPGEGPNGPAAPGAPGAPAAPGAPGAPKESAVPGAPKMSAAPGAPKESAAPGAPKESAAPGAPKMSAAPGAPKESAAPGAPKESGAPKDPAPKDPAPKMSSMPPMSMAPKETAPKEPVPAPKETGMPKMSSMMSMSMAPKETAPKEPAPKETGMPKMSSMMSMTMSMAPKETPKESPKEPASSTVSKESIMPKESATMPKMSMGSMTMSMTMSMAPGETMSAGVPMPMPKSSELPGMTMSGMTMSGMTMSGMPGGATSTPAAQTGGASSSSGPSSLLAAFGLALLALWA